jgi:hypothetical protein
MQWSPEVGVSRESLQHREPDGELSAATVTTLEPLVCIPEDSHRLASECQGFATDVLGRQRL